jgi:hypothetical protein
MANDKDFVVAGAVEVGKDTKVTLGTVTSNNIDLATGNYFADTLAANTTYTLSNAGDVQSFQLEVTGGSIGYDIASATYSGNSFSVGPQDSQPNSITFKSDGTSFYMIGDTTGSVYQYNLSTAYDISTASYASKSFSVSQESNEYGLSFSSDGTKMYVCGSQEDTVFQYTLSTAWDVSTASYASKSYPSGQTTGTTNVAFNNDGTKMYISGWDVDQIFQYTLSTAWDVSTASYDSKSLSVGSQEANIRDFTFWNNGTTILITGNTDDTVYEYTLSTAYDVSTGSYSGNSFSYTGQDGNGTGVMANPDGSSVYVSGTSTDTVYQYSTASTVTVTWPSSIEWAGGIAPSAPATGETDVYTLVTDDGGTSYVGVKTADNLS